MSGTKNVTQVSLKILSSFYTWEIQLDGWIICRDQVLLYFLHFIRNDKRFWNLIPSLLRPCPPLQYLTAVTTNLSISTCLPWLSNRKLRYGIAYRYSLFALSHGHKYIWRNRNPQNQYIVSVMYKSYTAFATKKKVLVHSHFLTV